MKRIRTIGSGLWIILLAIGAVAASAQTDSHPGTVLVELFTSEGCSSCPPADEVLRQIDGKKTHAGDLIVGISEHVTYWDYLGWHDPFGSDATTQRQHDYADRFRTDGVYTPQMVINGERQMVGSDRAEVTRAIEAVHEKPVLTLTIASVRPDGDGVSVVFSLHGPVGTIPAGKVDVYAVIAEDTTSSKVERGENSGHVLTHVAVARSLRRVATVTNDTEHTVHLPQPLAGKAAPGQRRHLILFAQAPGLGQVYAVESSPL